MMRSTLVTEARLRMRPWSTFASLVLIVLLVAGFGIAAYALVGIQARSLPQQVLPGLQASSVPQQFSVSTIVASQRGVSLFVVLAIFVMVVTCLATGIQSSTAIVSEKERQTFDLLWTTKLRPGTLLWGKFVTSVGFGLVMLAVVLPVFSLVLVYNGVPWQTTTPVCLLLLTSLTASAAVGLSFSAVASSTLSASLLTALTLLVGLFGSAGLYVAALLAGFGTGWQIMLYASPPAAMLSAVVGAYKTPTTLLLPVILRASPEHPVHLVGHIQYPFPLWAATALILVLITGFLLSTTGAMLALTGSRMPRGVAPLWVAKQFIPLRRKEQR